jgi:hypothetical protein
MSKKRAVRNTRAWKQNHRSPSGRAGYSGETMRERRRRMEMEELKLQKFIRAVETGDANLLR